MKLESNASIKTRISNFTGFRTSEITLMEASYSGGICTHVDFVVKGKGFFTDFVIWGFNPVWDN